MSRRPGALAGLSIAPATAILEDRPAGQQIGRIALDRMRPNPQQPRKMFDEEGLLLLAADIKANGQQSHIKVLPADADGMHRIVYGERRWRAMRKIAGWTVANVIIDNDLDDEDAIFDHALAENIQRESLTRSELADALINRKERYGETNGELARRFHKSEAWAEQHIRYGQLPAPTRALMDSRGIGLQVATAIDRFADEATQLAVLEQVPVGASRDQQLGIVRTARSIHAAGADISDATSRAADLNNSAADPPRGGDPTPRRGRPRKVSVPFVLEEVRGGTPQVVVNVMALASSGGLLTTRQTGPRRWLESVREDLVAYRDLCASHGGGGDDWALAQEMLGPVMCTE